MLCEKNMKYIIVTKSIGLLFILVGTLIATAKLPSIDRLVGVENESIAKFEDQRILAGISILKASHIANLKQLYLMEANIATYTGQERERQNVLRQKALNQYATEIRNWNTLFSKGEKSELFQKTEKEIQDIAQDNELLIEQKLEKVEKIKLNTRDQASERLTTAHQKRNKHKVQKEKLEKSRLAWNTIFLWLQILGIALLTSSEILEKLFIKNT